MTLTKFDAVDLFASVSTGAERPSFGAGERIFIQGNSADSVFYIQRGEVKKFLAAPDGTPCLIGHLKAGDFFGAGSLLGLRQRRTTAIAATPCTIVRLEKLAVLNALYQYPDIADLFISFLVDRNRHYRETLPVRRGIAATKLIQD